MIAREAAAAAVGTTRSADISSGSVDGGSAADKPRLSNNSPHFYWFPFTEVPFPIEKLFHGDKNLCRYFSNEVIPSSGDGSNVFIIDNTSPLSSTYHTDGEITQAVNPVHHSSFITLSNQSPISRIVTDRYHIGHLLQALLQHLCSFKSCLKENLIQWVTYGPVISNDSNALSFHSNNPNNNTRP
ncbi:unnamed protein product [Schistosoma margrebowiei]|uniref:Uncharacterized protein n=1 Tax=Schistosoma margrebowiei TaxID=48269 RepID=A0A183N1I6_9TREM|nr:unnamed protein product [Schistosoma margrebowiei]